MLNEVKKIVKMFEYKVSYNNNILYLVFEDNTKVNAENCEYYGG